MSAPIYHCPFCAEENLRPVEEPSGAWHCIACARIFSVTLHGLDETRIPGRIAASATDDERLVHP